LASLLRAAGAVDKRRIDALLDPVLDLIQFGFMNLLSRYAEPLQRLPYAEIPVGRDVLSLFTVLGGKRDGPHVFDLGTELMKAEIAWRLGKRHAQDSPLDLGCAACYPRPVSKTQPRRRLILASHLHMLAREKIEQEITYLEISVSRPPLPPKKRHVCQSILRGCRLAPYTCHITDAGRRQSSTSVSKAATGYRGL
jgi:hypothetical protein